jgi:outer membrane lipoprotein SlyB
MKATIIAVAVIAVFVLAGCVSSYTCNNGSVYAENCIIKEEIKVVDGKPTVTKRVIIPAESIFSTSIDKIVSGLKSLFGEGETK